MVRLMLTLAPAACMLGAIGFSGLLSTFSAHLKIAWRGQAAAKEAPARAAEVADKPAGAGAGAAADASGSVAAAAGVARASKQAAAKEAAASPSTMPPVMSLAVLAGTGAMLLFYTLHATYVSSEAYSSPSIVLASKRADGSRVIFDDFREAYYWCVAGARACSGLCESVLLGAVAAVSCVPPRALSQQVWRACGCGLVPVTAPL
jgi:dolichyl-diphosphooligosaccharide--protein glycosyltransferase